LTSKLIPLQTQSEPKKLSTLTDLKDRDEKKLARKINKEREITNNEANFLKCCRCCIKSKDSKIKSKILEIGE
jgi:hypothetical protein